jgi:DNA-binding transcriptional MerR regulator
MTAKLYKAADVCDLTQLQPYVLRSWEKEFPGIGVQKTADGPRIYRKADIEQVLRIKQLVFGEGLTLAGARRRLDDPKAAPIEVTLAAIDEDDSGADTSPRAERTASRREAAVADDEVRARIATVREGLQSILSLLSVGGEAALERIAMAPPPARPQDYELEPVESAVRKVRKLTARRPAAKTAPVAKRKRASA